MIAIWFLSLSVTALILVPDSWSAAMAKRLPIFVTAFAWVRRGVDAITNGMNAVSEAVRKSLVNYNKPRKGEA